MKLLSKTSYYYLLLSCILFLTGGGVFYYYISGLLNEEINEQLEIEHQRILKYSRQTWTLPEIPAIASDEYLFTKTDKEVQKRFSDTMLLSPLKDEFLPYRTLIFPLVIADQQYVAMIIRPLIEKDDLLQSISKSLGFLFMLMLTSLFIFNRWVSSRLWKPFYQTLHQLKKTELNSGVVFPIVHIQEFNELHLELNRMLDRINQQYRTLKEFTENASHELQTPLAIIRNNLENLLQSTKLQESDHLNVIGAYESTNRLSRLYQSLLLLSKIENRQFNNLQPCIVMDIVNNRLELFGELKAYKNIMVNINGNVSPIVEMDSYLAEVLFSNLIGNAFKYCPQDGEIRFSTNEHSLTISNSGPPLSVDINQLYDRFVKGTESNESSGLGLAIVRQICEIYDMNISYSYASSMHTFTIHF